MISTYYARLIHRELELMGKLSADLWSEAGLTADDLITLEHLPEALFHRYLSTAIKLSGDKAFGLRFGRYAGAFSAGFAGLATVTAPRLKESLQAYVSFSRLVASAIDLELDVIQRGSNSYLRIRVIEKMDMADTCRTQLEVLTYTLQNTLEATIGQPFTSGRYNFAYAAPSYADQYIESYGCPCFFNEPQSSFEIPEALTLQPLPAFNQQLWELSLAQCNRLCDEASSTQAKVYYQRVIEILHSSGVPLLTSPEVAKALHLSTRTLNRRLANEACNFREIRLQVQMGLAKQYLQQSMISIDAISTLLGYQDPANFRRACKQYYGCTPQKLRAPGDS